MIKIIYLDNSATSLNKPDCVIEAVVNALRNFGNPSRGNCTAGLDADRCIYDCRKKLAELFSAPDFRRIAFTKNATEALNLTFYGLLDNGCHVITSANEHNSVLRPLYKLEKEGRISLSILPLDKKGNIVLDEIYSLKTDKTKAIVLTHASNVTGNVTDLYKAGRIAKEIGAHLIVDASQSAGHIEINMANMNIAVLCFTGHKGLLGPQGTGGLAFSKDVDIKNLLSGGSGIHSFDKEQPQKYPLKLEAGTPNTPGIAGLSAGIDYISKNGLESLHAKEQSLVNAFLDGIKGMRNIVLYGDYEVELRCPIVSLNIEGKDSSLVSLELESVYSVSTRPGAHCAPLVHKHFNTVESGMVRFSFSHANSMEEVNFVIDALKKIAH